MTYKTEIMLHEPAESVAPVPMPQIRRLSNWRRAALVLGAIVGLYLVAAYFLAPLGWIFYVHRHPALDETPGITLTSDDHPGDPINVGLIGSEADVKRIMLDAKWLLADHLGLRSDLKIAADTVLKRPYGQAPVSNLYLFGRKEDLAFEQPVGNNPRERHHVRFWKSDKLDDQGRPLWSGSATFDLKVGLSHTTGQITHHIATEVDTERDFLIDTLKQTGQLGEVQSIAGFHQILEGRNGGGDLWKTDGRLLIGTIQATTDSVSAP